MIDLVCPTDAIEDLLASLLSTAPNEAVAVFLCHVYDTPKSLRRFLVREIFGVPKEAYIEQCPDRVTVDPIFLARILKHARETGSSVMFVHTHPFSEWPMFSPVDDNGEKILMPVVFQRVPGRIHGAVVLGQRGFSARLHNQHPEHSKSVDTMVLVGREIRREEKCVPDIMVDKAHDRNVRAFGDGQQKLQRMSVGVVGLGGIGSIVTEQLAHLGVGSLTLIDFDDLDITDLNRVAGASQADIGTPKVEVAKQHVKRISCRINVEAVHGSVLKESDARSLLDCDFVFCCTDSHGSRAVLNQLAYQYFIPVIDTGVRIDALDGTIISMAGRVQMLAPGLPCLACGNLLDAEEVRRDFLSDVQRKEDPYITGHRVPQPAIMSINGTVASLAVTMFLSATVGVPSPGRHLLYLIGESVVRRIGGDPASDCIVCSVRGSYARGDDWQMIWKP